MGQITAADDGSNSDADSHHQQRNTTRSTNLYCNLFFRERVRTSKFFRRKETGYVRLKSPIQLYKMMEEIYGTTHEIAASIKRLLVATNLYALYSCSCCNRDIFPGNACISIYRRIEQVEVCNGRRTTIVIDADSMATFCAACGDHFSYYEKWRKSLIGSLSLKSGDLQPKICDHCFGPIEECEPHMSIELMIAQIDPSVDSAGEWCHVPIYSETVLRFCPDCKSSLTDHRLKDAVMDFISQASCTDGGI